MPLVHLASEIVQKVDTRDQAQELLAVDNNRDMPTLEYRQQRLDGRTNVEHLQVADHRSGDRVTETRFISVYVHQHVRFVEDADQATTVHHWQLRHIVEL